MGWASRMDYLPRDVGRVLTLPLGSISLHWRKTVLWEEDVTGTLALRSWSRQGRGSPGGHASVCGQANPTPPLSPDANPKSDSGSKGTAELGAMVPQLLCPGWG